MEESQSAAAIWARIHSAATGWLDDHQLVSPEPAKYADREINGNNVGRCVQECETHPGWTLIEGVFFPADVADRAGPPTLPPMAEI